MSTIVVVKKDKRIVIGADTLQSQGSIKIRNIYQPKHEKIFKFGQSYIGSIGSSAFHHVLPSVFRKHKDLIHLNSAEEIFETLLKLQPILIEDYYIKTDENDDDTQEFESNQIYALIANRSGAYEIQSYREVHNIGQFWAIGSGKRFALGAMHAIYKSEKNPRVIAEKGLQAACEFDDGSDLPLQIKSISLE